MLSDGPVIALEVAPGRSLVVDPDAFVASPGSSPPPSSPACPGARWSARVPASRSRCASTAPDRGHPARGALSRALRERQRQGRAGPHGGRRSGPSWRAAARCSATRATSPSARCRAGRRPARHGGRGAGQRVERHDGCQRDRVGAVRVPGPARHRPRPRRPRAAAGRGRPAARPRRRPADLGAVDRLRAGCGGPCAARRPARACSPRRSRRRSGRAAVARRHVPAAGAARRRRRCRPAGVRRAPSGSSRSTSRPRSAGATPSARAAARPSSCRSPASGTVYVQASEKKL